MKAVISGVGIHLPEFPTLNSDLEKFVDTNDEWIRTRTGIEQRYIFDREDQELKTSDIAISAAKKLLDQTGVSPSEIDGIIMGSMYPDKVFPATACVVQAALDCDNAFAFDITAACALYPYAVNIASLMIESGQAKNIIVIGAELSSRVVDWSDRNTCVLFGDAGSATLLSSSDEQTEDGLVRGVLTSTLRSRGKAQDILNLNNLGSGDSFIEMDGRQVFKIAVVEMASIVEESLAKLGFKPSDLDLLLPHQANIRILDATAKKLGLSEDQVFTNVHKYGNTSSASIPLAISEALQEGRLKKGDLVATVGIGGGMTWGCNIIRW
jgi:3-oxoacyl-[acyl-carrier-protein] synthase-3